MIPVWDEYTQPLGEALVSLRTQERSVRVIVVDNASRTELPALDGSDEVVRAPHRLSLGAARNLGLRHVTTPFVIFWDADDVMLPGALNTLEQALEADTGLVLFGMAIRESPSGLRHRWPRPWLARLVRVPRVLAVLHCVWSQFPTTGATIIRTDAARVSGGFADAQSGEDWCLGASLVFRGRIGWTEEFGRIYRLNPQSVWARHLTIRHQRQHALAVRQRLRDDPDVPRWCKCLMPTIWLAQYAALGAHALVALVRTTTWGSS